MARAAAVSAEPGVGSWMATERLQAAARAARARKGVERVGLLIMLVCASPYSFVEGPNCPREKRFVQGPTVVWGGCRPSAARIALAWSESGDQYPKVSGMIGEFQLRVPTEGSVILGGEMNQPFRGALA